MAVTARPHRFSVPMATRGSDVRSIQQCPASWMLNLFYEEQKAEASYFILGDALHWTIEHAITEEWGPNWATEEGLIYLNNQAKAAQDSGRRLLESSKRGFDTLHDDFTRIFGKWWQDVHPDSDKRFPIYDQYEWPPAVEVEFEMSAENAGTQYPVWGTVDALFLPDEPGEPGAIVDWKTGSKPHSDPEQLWFYMFGLGLPNVRGWFHHADGLKYKGKIQEIESYPGDDHVRNQILSTEAQKESDYWETRPDWYCNYCPVQEFCPAEGADPRQAMLDFKKMLKYRKPLL